MVRSEKSRSRRPTRGGVETGGDEGCSPGLCSDGEQPMDVDLTAVLAEASMINLHLGLLI